MGLNWQPLHVAMDELAHKGDNLILIVAPFIKLQSLDLLVRNIPSHVRCQVVSRWRPEDLVAGVSDLEVFEYLKRRGWPLFVHSRVHMKLYVFESNVAFMASGNLTMNGLGYTPSNIANVEVGATVNLAANDWVNLYQLFGESRLMTEELYARYVEHVRSQPKALPPPAAVDLVGPARAYTLASLPATETPLELGEFYASMSTSRPPCEAERRCYHDLATFRIQAGLSAGEFEVALGEAWRRNPFVRDFAEHLRQQGSLRFGAVNAWIQEKCDDVPLPYRWEIKTNTRIFYNWMAHYYPEVTWDRPTHSQVIFWERES